MFIQTRPDMQRTRLVACLVLLVSVAASPADKKKATVDPRLLTAQFVCIVSASGDDLDPSTQSGDRAAIIAVEQAIKSWGRFRVVYNQDNADVLLVVRTGRYVRASTGGTVPIGPVPIPGKPGPVTGGGIRIGGEPAKTGPEVDAANVSDDMISIYDNRTALDNMKSTSVLWRKIMRHGLAASPNGKVPLVEELKKDVEAATPASGKKPWDGA